MYVFFNGQFVTEEAACISASDRGFTVGDGVFDTLLAENGALKWGAEHFTRLLAHAAVMQIEQPYDTDDLLSFAQALIGKNKLGHGTASVRTAITRGSGGRGLSLPDNPEPTIIMKAVPVDLTAMPREVRITIAGTVRRNEHSPLSRIKSSNYGDNILALLEARERGYQDALLLNTKGHIACSTTGNVFACIDGRLVTPPLADGVMDGVTRQKIIEQFDVSEEPLLPEDLQQAAYAFLTNSISGLRAITQVDHIALAGLSALPATLRQYFGL